MRESLYFVRSFPFVVCLCTFSPTPPHSPLLSSCAFSFFTLKYILAVFFSSSVLVVPWSECRSVPTHPFYSSSFYSISFGINYLLDMRGYAKLEGRCWDYISFRSTFRTWRREMQTTRKKVITRVLGLTYAPCRRSTRLCTMYGHIHQHFPPNLAPRDPRYHRQLII